MFKITDFFTDLRASTLFNGSMTSSQVVGTNSLLQAAQAAQWSISWTAYLLATAYHETSTHMVAINEFGSAAYFDNRYGPQTEVGKRLGNTQPGDGNRFHGRGIVQITGRDNYARIGKCIGADLVSHPELALDSAVSVKIAVGGMEGGWFTGISLKSFLNNKCVDAPQSDSNFMRARRIINGQDCADKIAAYANLFQKSLAKGEWSDVIA